MNSGPGRRLLEGASVLLVLGLAAHQAGCKQELVPVPKPRCAADTDCAAPRHICDLRTQRCVDTVSTASGYSCQFKNAAPAVLDDLSSLPEPAPGDSPREFPGPILMFRQTSSVVRVAAQHGHDGPVRVWTADLSRQTPDFSQYVDKEIEGDLVAGSARGPSAILQIARATTVEVPASSSSGGAASTSGFSSSGGASSTAVSTKAGYMVQRVVLPTGDRIGSADEILVESLTEAGLAWDEAELGALAVFGSGSTARTYFAASVEDRPPGHEYYWVVTGDWAGTPVPVRSLRESTEADGNAEDSRAVGLSRTADATHVFIRSEMGQRRAFMISVPDDLAQPPGAPNYFGVPAADTSFIIAVHGDQDATFTNVAVGVLSANVYSVWAGRVAAARLPDLTLQQDLRQVLSVTSEHWSSLPVSAPLGSAVWAEDSRDPATKDLVWVGRPLLEGVQDPGLAFLWVESDGTVNVDQQLLTDRPGVEKATVLMRDNAAGASRVSFSVLWTETVTPASGAAYQTLLSNELVCVRSGG